MHGKFTFITFLILLLVILAIFTTLPLWYKKKVIVSSPVGSLSWDRQHPNNVSPSFLLLSNWKNLSVFVQTGIPNVLGVPWGPLDVYSVVGPYVNVTVEGSGNSTFASLTLNNTVIINNSLGNAVVIFPPYSNYLVLTQTSRTERTMYLIEVSYGTTILTSDHAIYVRGKENLTIFSPNSTFSVIDNRIYINSTQRFSYIEIVFKENGSFLPLSTIEDMNYKEVSKWLNESLKPNIPTDLLPYYYISLLVIKDDQNPILGDFVASPSPIYFYAWVRDGSFSAMALQLSGHYNSAEKYWLWMASVQNSSGDWYTRYDFVTGTPDTTFGIPEYDSVGLFLIGVSQYYKLTHNMTFLNKVNKSVIKAINWIEDNSKGHLLPEDLSVWESTYAYNFWTQAFDDLGLKYISEIPYYANFVNETVEENLNKSTLSAFYINNSFISGAVTPAVLFENGKSMIVYSTVYGADSSTILPISMGYLPPSSIIGIYDAKTIVKLLTINGGIARFYDDQYHYSIQPIDSSAPTPPWIITTLFLAYYYEYIENYSGALNLMEWCVEHSMHGLLPEAVDPMYGNPLPSTSPLTWSSAMFVIVSINYKQ